MYFLTKLAELFDGNMGWSILVLSVAVRLILLPLTLHLSRKMLKNRRKIMALRTQVDEIKGRLADEPKQMMKEISKLHRDNGAKLFDISKIQIALIQLPIFGMMYGAINKAGSLGNQFMWIKSLASPDAFLTGLTLCFLAIGAYFLPHIGGNYQVFLVVLQVTITGLCIWKLSAGLGLYWLGSSIVGAIQTSVLRLEHDRHTAA